MRERRELQDALADAQQRLLDGDAGPFSTGAYRQLQTEITDYITSLVRTATNTARRHRADIVSLSDVQKAADYLSSDPAARFSRHIGTVGGILVGAAVSNALTMVTTEVLTVTGVAVTVVLTLVGAFMVAFHIARD